MQTQRGGKFIGNGNEGRDIHEQILSANRFCNKSSLVYKEHAVSNMAFIMIFQKKIRHVCPLTMICTKLF